MTTIHNRVLVAAPYSQRLGVAVFAGSDLLHYAVITFRLPRTERSVRNETSAQLKQLFEEFCPGSLLIKKLSRRQTKSPNQWAVIEQLSTDAGAAGVRIAERSFEEAKRDLSGGNASATNTEAFLKLMRIYPELERLGHFRNRHQREYYVPVLTAVAIGRSRCSAL